jgi:threonine/homoserine/homoserine lactone efflux protein
MAAYALAASLSPGPVNLLTLRAGALRGAASGLRVASSATVSFTALLLLAGLGLQSVWERLPLLQTALRFGGVAFLLWMAWQLARDDGALAPPTAAAHGAAAPAPAPSARLDHGAWFAALAQWLNPKAWLAALAGVGLFTTDSGGLDSLLRFVAIYAIVCMASMACWALAGAWLGARVRSGPGLRMLNQALAVLLVLSALALLL